MGFSHFATHPPPNQNKNNTSCFVLISPTPLKNQSEKQKGKQKKWILKRTQVWTQQAVSLNGMGTFRTLMDKKCLTDHEKARWRREIPSHRHHYPTKQKDVRYHSISNQCGVMLFPFYHLFFNYLSRS